MGSDYHASVQMLRNLAPELVLVATAVWMVMVGVFAKRPRDWSLFSAAGLLTAGLGVFMQSSMMTPNLLSGDAPPLPAGPVALDAMSLAVRGLAVTCALLLTASTALGGGKRLSAEFQASLLLATAGVMLTSAAMDLVLLFVALELISIPTYVLLFLGRNDRDSAEATLKYFLLSILSSAVMLYGFSMLYGVAGSTELPQIAAALRSRDPQGDALSIAALAMIVSGLAFKVAAVPFHFYAPDVYQGTTNANAGVLAVLPKIAGVAALIRLVAVGMPGLELYGWQVLSVVAVMTMTLGNFAALWQTNLRRLMAYSSIAHTGYLLIGVSAALALGSAGVDRQAGVSATVLYLAMYSFGSIGAFAAFAFLSNRQRELNTIEQLRGLGRSYPVAAAVLGVSMLSLTGIPPLGGFWGKLLLIMAALKAAWSGAGPAMSAWMIALAVVAVVNAAVSAVYYLRIVAAVFFQSADEAAPQPGAPFALGAAAVAALLLLAVGVAPGGPIRVADGAGKAAIFTARHYELFPIRSKTAQETAAAPTR